MKDTMVTGARGQKKLTRNIYHVKRFFLAPGGELASGIDAENGEEEGAEPVLEPGASSSRETGVRPTRGEENGEGNKETEQHPGVEPADRGSQSRYHLRNNPTPSSRLRDYALWCEGTRPGGQ